MTSSAALSQSLDLPVAAHCEQAIAPVGATSAAVGARLFRSLDEVETIWRTLQAEHIASPSQSIDFVRAWIEARNIHPRDQAYVVGLVDGQPAALLPLHRRLAKGVRIYSWFAGSHVGCHAPLLDRERFGKLSRAERAKLWKSMTGTLSGADLLYLRTVPEGGNDPAGTFEELGTALAVETLYRSAFTSWAECDTTQRNKSRRKHDRQQGDRLEALGTVAFEVVGNGDCAKAVLDTMFRQRAERFKAMGIADPFTPRGVRQFYDRLAEADSGVEVRLHVLRLDGDIVAVRFNVRHGDQLFCLISSMSEDPAIQGGSPGKQCLLRVMQTEFDQGTRVFDMGGGLTDEKRHWCNQQIELRHRYVPLNPWGALAASTHRFLQAKRAEIKANERLLELIKRWRQKLPLLRH